MSRNFNGANDVINYGSDASIDNFAQKSIGLWLQRSSIDTNDFIFGKDRAIANWGCTIRGAAAPANVFSFEHGFSVTDGEWRASTVISTGVLHHVVITYNNASILNDPVVTINGIDDTITEATSPAGAADSDATPNLLQGENGGGVADFGGDMGWLVYASGIWDAAQKNRHRWWGTPGGAVALNHPLVTSNLTNKGTATANGTATGTTMSSIPRVERNLGTMMGCGR